MSNLGLAIRAALGLYGVVIVLVLATVAAELLNTDVDRFDVYGDIDPDAPIPYELDSAYVPDGWLTEYRAWSSSHDGGDWPW